MIAKALISVFAIAVAGIANAAEVSRQQDLFQYALRAGNWTGASQTNRNGEMHCLAERRFRAGAALYLSRVADRHSVSMRATGWRLTGREAKVVFWIDNAEIGTWSARVADGKLVHVSLGDGSEPVLNSLRRGRILKVRIEGVAEPQSFDLAGSRTILDELARCVEHFDGN